MSPFTIVQIGEDVQATDGLPDGCDLCGHCRMLRGTLPAGSLLPCGASVRRNVAAEAVATEAARTPLSSSITPPNS